MSLRILARHAVRSSWTHTARTQVRSIPSFQIRSSLQLETYVSFSLAHQQNDIKSVNVADWNIIGRRYKGKKSKKAKKKDDPPAAKSVEQATEQVEYNFDFDKVKESMQSALLRYAEHLKQLRSGRVQADLFDHLQVNLKSERLPFNAVAQTTVKSPSLVVVNCFDESYVKPAVQAIQTAQMNLTAVPNGTALHVKIPPVTQEARQDTVKVAAQHREKVKVVINQIRRDAIKSIKAYKAQGISEDVLAADTKKVEALLEVAKDKVDDAFTKKEQEILAHS